MKIAMISYYLPSGSKIGVGHQVHTVANGLADRGHEVTVFSGCGPSEGSRYKTIQIPLSGSFRTFRFAFAIRRLDLRRFDVLHAHGDDYWLWSRRVQVHVRTMHGSCFEEAIRISGIKEKMRMLLLGLSEELATLVADRTVVVSPATRRWMPWVRTVIPNAVADPFSSVHQPKEPAPTILFVGTYEQRKRGAFLAQVFQDEIRPNMPDAQLWMVARDAPSNEQVTVFGRVSEIQLAELYQRAWVFCLPSTYEGFGIPYAEALASGTPVVATPNPGSRYVLEEGKYGVLVGDAELGRRLLDLLGNDRERADLSRRGRDRAEQFTLKSVLDSYEEIYAGVGHKPGLGA